MDIDGTDKPGRGRRLRRGLPTAFAAVAMTIGNLAAATEVPVVVPDYEPVLAAAFNGMAGRVGSKVGLPDVLSRADAARYQKALDLQQRGQWTAADRELAAVGDDLLKGHLLAHRYLHARYKPKFEELHAWLNVYGDLPDAQRLHALADRYRPAGTPPLKAPAKGYLSGTGIDTADTEANWEDVTLEPGDHLGPGQKSRVKTLKAKFRELARQQSPAARRMLDDAEVKRLFGEADFDEMKAVLAAYYFAGGNDAAALEWALQAADRSGDRLPGAHWTAGMASWRLGRHDDARRHFEAVANARDGSGWMVAAGAYWAARANLVARRPEVVNHWLDIAASYPRTFYGLLARRALGHSVQFAWEPLPLTDIDVDNLRRVPAGKRALALLQIGEKRRAEEELRRLYPTATPAVAQSMLALANVGDLPELALRLGGVVADRDGRYHDNAAFPLPGWTPQGGWTIDRALVLAIARQESAFNPKAVSPAGAAGLMQLMPETARFLARQPVAREKLVDAQYNLALGQRYIRHLLDHEAIGGNLFLLVAAYNGGPGNLIRWMKSINHGDDPLLFIESIPSRETRIFVERVMTNFWIYRSRIGQPSPSLDTIVAGDWPRYDAHDGRPQTANLAR